MKRLLLIVVLLLGFIGTAYAEINWVDGYYTTAGQYRGGHWKDTSGDGNEYNNANYIW